MNLKRVVVTGLDSLTPIGKTTLSHWDDLLGGVSGTCLITRFDVPQNRRELSREIKKAISDDCFYKRLTWGCNVNTVCGVKRVAEAMNDALFGLYKVAEDANIALLLSGDDDIKTSKSGYTQCLKSGCAELTSVVFSSYVADVCANPMSIEYNFFNTSLKGSAEVASFVVCLVVEKEYLSATNNHFEGYKDNVSLGLLCNGQGCEAGSFAMDSTLAYGEHKVCITFKNM